MILTQPIEVVVSELFTEALELGRVTRFKKVGRVIFRPVVPGETVITIVDGKVETLKKGADDEVVIRNIQPGANAEQYIIGGAKFKGRYELTGQVHAIDGQRWEVALPTGECECFEYHGDPITFKAPWGEQMICIEGDYLVRTPGSGLTDIYRIARSEFDRTYTSISN